MKYKILFLFFAFAFCNAQLKKSPIIQAQYIESVNQDSPITNKFVGTLYFQDNISYYKSEYKNSENESNKKSDDIIEIKSEALKFVNEVYTNKKTKELVENMMESKFLKKTYSIIDNNIDLKWKISKEERTFNGVVCKKATTVFRGRTYTAWFTEKYPIAAGPWKFHGLPGLILYVEDSKGYYKWQLINIVYPYKGNNINLEEAFNKRFRYNKISFKEFDALYINAIKNKIDIVKSRSSDRNGMSGSFSYSTEFEKEPINEWRTQTYFR